MKQYTIKKIRTVLFFAISTFFIAGINFPSQYFIPSAQAILPAIALPEVIGAAISAGRVILLNGTRVAVTASETGGAANGAIYGTVAANSPTFIAHSIVAANEVAAAGGINGYLTAAATALMAATGVSAYYKASTPNRR